MDNLDLRVFIMQSQQNENVQEQQQPQKRSRDDVESPYKRKRKCIGKPPELNFDDIPEMGFFPPGSDDFSPKSTKVSFSDTCRCDDGGTIDVKHIDGPSENSRFFRKFITEYCKTGRINSIERFVTNKDIHSIEDICCRLERIAERIREHGFSSVLSDKKGMSLKFTEMHLYVIEDLLDKVEEYHDRC